MSDVPYVIFVLFPIPAVKSNFAKSWLHSILSDNRIHEHVGSVEGSLTDCAIYPGRKTSGLPVSPAQSPLL